LERLDLRVLTDALGWKQAGYAVSFVTVVETWGSAPRPPGALVAIRGDGVVSGSVSVSVTALRLVPGACIVQVAVLRQRDGQC